MTQDEAVASLLSTVGLLWPPPFEVHLRTRPGRAIRESGLDYVLLPNLERPHLLAPSWPPAASAAALSRYKEPLSRAHRLKSRALRAAGSAGLASLLPNGLRVSGPPGATSLLDHLSAQLGTRLWAGIYLGPPRANRKPVLQLMNKGGHMLAFAKVGTNELTQRLIEHEAQSLQRLHSASLPSMLVPRLLEFGSWGQCRYLVQSPVPTQALQAPSTAILERAQQEFALGFDPEIAELGDHPRWSSTIASLDSLQETADGGPDAAALRHRVAAAEDLSEGRALVWGASHGDWAPWNMAAVHGQLSVWDWERFETDVPVGVDALHLSFQRSLMAGKPAAEALAAVQRQASTLVIGNGGQDAAAAATFVFYLVFLGERYIRDGQLKAGEGKGPLREWLVPVLDDVLTNGVG